MMINLGYVVVHKKRKELCRTDSGGAKLYKSAKLARAAHSHPDYYERFDTLYWTLPVTVEVPDVE